MATKSNPEGMKFKVGDKVRVLPCAVSAGMREDEVGTLQIVVKILHPTTVLITDSVSGHWWVGPDKIKLVSRVGEQLVFSFMK